jgi:hypothetical protein
MRTLTALCIFIAPFLLASAIENQEKQDRYEHCITSGAVSVFTDMDAAILEHKCRSK